LLGFEFFREIFPFAALVHFNHIDEAAATYQGWRRPVRAGKWGGISPKE